MKIFNKFSPERCGMSFSFDIFYFIHIFTLHISSDGKKAYNNKDKKLFLLTTANHAYMTQQPIINAIIIQHQLQLSNKCLARSRIYEGYMCILCNWSEKFLFISV